MHGSLEKPDKAEQNIYGSWGMRLLAIPALLLTALIGLDIAGSAGRICRRRFDAGSGSDPDREAGHGNSHRQGLLMQAGHAGSGRAMPTQGWRRVRS